MKKLYQMTAMLTAVLCMLTAAGCAMQTGQNSGSAENSTADTAVSQSEEAECDEQQGTDVQQGTEAVLAEELSAPAAAALPELTDADRNTEWGADAVQIAFDGSSAEITGNGAQAANGAVTIKKGGDYVVSGKSDSGSITVELADDSEKVHLVLNGVSLTCKNGAALNVTQADKVIVTLADGTENILTDTGEAGDDSGACIMSASDLTINGSGSLTVNGNRNNGIHCSDDLKIVDGTVTVNAANHGLRGNDSAAVFGGTLNITAGGDGIKTVETEKDGKGYAAMLGGTVHITAEQDGIDAATSLTVTDGDLNVSSGGGAVNAEPHTDNMPGGFGGFGGRSGRNKSTEKQDDSTGAEATPAAAFASDETEEKADASESAKGLKAGTILTVSGGTVRVDAAQDALHANGELLISDEKEPVLSLSAGDDGIHADNSMIIEGGTVDITRSYEGIEAAAIMVSGGSVRVRASDDGFNASDGSGGGMGFSRNGSGELVFSGGYVYVNADGDGLDSNGNITMTGGTVIVCGPTGNMNGPLDSGDNNNLITVTGGTLIAVGSTGMMEVPEKNYLSSKELNAEAGSVIAVTDEFDRVLAVLKIPKQAKGIVVSADGMADGYQIYKDVTYKGTLNEDGFSTGGEFTGGTLVASGSGGEGGMNPGGFGGKTPSVNPDEFRDNMTPPDMPEDFRDNMTPPEGFNFEPPEGFDGDVPEGFEGQLPGNRNEMRGDRGGRHRQDSESNSEQD